MTYIQENTVIMYIKCIVHMTEDDEILFLFSNF